VKIKKLVAVSFSSSSIVSETEEKGLC